MLKQASVDQVRKQKLSRTNSLIVITMCFYPRGIKKEWRDDFRNILAPDKHLFAEWKAIEKQQGHDVAFVSTNYERRFLLSPVALFHLKLYSEISCEKDVYFVCQCQIGERCHRELLLLTAQKKYAAKIDKVFHAYPVFEERILSLDDQIKMWGS